MAALDIAILGPALPALRVEFGLGPSGSAWLVTLYVLGNLVGTPLLGSLSDRWGRGRAYRASVTLFALGSVLILVAPNLLVLLAAVRFKVSGQAVYSPWRLPPSVMLSHPSGKDECSAPSAQRSASPSCWDRLWVPWFCPSPTGAGSSA